MKLRDVFVRLVALSAFSVLPFSAALAGDEVDYWAVTGVAANDVLHLRDVPSADGPSLAGIPPKARGLKNLGCRRSQPAFQDWARMTDAERNLARTRWCRIEFNGQQGWVAWHFLKKDGGPAR